MIIQKAERVKLDQGGGGVKKYVQCTKADIVDQSTETGTGVSRRHTVVKTHPMAREPGASARGIEVF